MLADYTRATTGIEPDMPRTTWQTVQALLFFWARWIGIFALRLFRTFGRYLANVANYYRAHRPQLTEYVLEYFEGAQSVEKRQREVRVRVTEDHRNAKFSRNGWRVEFPEVCFVCSERTNRPRLKRSQRIEDFSGPFWLPFGSAVAGLLLSLTFWNFWLLPLALVLGFIAGYQCRRYVEVRSWYSRCERHASPSLPPHMRVFSDLIVIRLPNKTVRQAFRRGGHSNAEANIEYWKEPDAPSIPTSIPLSEGSDTPIHLEDTVLLPPPSGDTKHATTDDDRPLSLG